MENASKAFLMAASVLMSVLVISLLVYLFSQLSSAEQTKANIEEINKIVEFSKKFEKFNRTIYGSELLSLANLYEDYNLKKVDLRGYTQVTIKVDVDTPMREGSDTYLEMGRNKDITEITTGIIQNLEVDIDTYENDPDPDARGRTIKQLAQLSNREIATIFGVSFHSDLTDYDVGEQLLLNYTTRNVMRKVETYKNIKTTYTQFKNTRFRCTEVDYDPDGRLCYLHFDEI